MLGVQGAQELGLPWPAHTLSPQPSPVPGSWLRPHTPAVSHVTPPAGERPPHRLRRVYAVRLAWPHRDAPPRQRASYRVSGDADSAFSSLVTRGSSFTLGRKMLLRWESHYPQCILLVPPSYAFPRFYHNVATCSAVEWLVWFQEARPSNEASSSPRSQAAVTLPLLQGG